MHLSKALEAPAVVHRRHTKQVSRAIPAHQVFVADMAGKQYRLFEIQPHDLGAKVRYVIRLSLQRPRDDTLNSGMPFADMRDRFDKLNCSFSRFDRANE